MTWIKSSNNTSPNPIVNSLGDSNGELTYNGQKVNKTTTPAPNPLLDGLGDLNGELTYNGQKVDKASTTNPIVDLLGVSSGELTYNGSKVDKITTTATVTQQSIWANKVWSAIGDSVTEISKNDNPSPPLYPSENGWYGYHDWITDWIGCTVNNYGISGTGWFTPSAPGETNAIWQRINAVDPNSDLITVCAGSNDWADVGKTLVLGTFGDTDPNISLYGAVDNTIQQLIAKFPLKTIAVFTSLPRNENDHQFGYNHSGITFGQIADVVIKVCNKYSIPCLDLFRNSNLYPMYSSTVRTNYMPDGAHPNKTGMAIVARKILAFLNTL